MRQAQAARDEFMHRFMQAMWYAAYEAMRVARDARDICVGFGPGAGTSSETDFAWLRNSLEGVDPAIAANVLQAAQSAWPSRMGMGTPPPGAAASGTVDMAKLKDVLQGLEPAEAARVIHAVQVVESWEAARRKAAEMPGRGADAW
ncbi:MAG: hypothetical protein K2X74_08305 [Acetobacteraceae bacterium]|nr:hypothetical protein [Acetobacteraceae bacterium]